MDQLSMFEEVKKPLRNDLQHPLFNMLASHIVDKFWHYHEENPKIFALYLRFAREAKKNGRGRYGIQMITERIRWHVNVETTGDDFKISNNHCSCYARLLAIMYKEEFGEFFQFNKTRYYGGTHEGKIQNNNEKTYP